MSLRPGVEHSIRLWKELPQNSEILKLCFDQYEEVFYRICDRKNVKHLVSVEKKFVAMFDDAKENDVKSIGTKDLRQMIELKHAKCKARPLRKDFDEKNPDGKVRSVTEKAFREVKSGKWEAAIATLSDLYCVGPATATAILCFVDPVVCYAADEVLNVVATRVYDFKTTIQMNKTLIKMAKTLNDNNKASSDSDFIWTPNHIGKSLYCWAIMNADKNYSGGAVTPMTDLIEKVNSGDEKNLKRSAGRMNGEKELSNKKIKK